MKTMNSIQFLNGGGYEEKFDSTAWIIYSSGLFLLHPTHSYLSVYCVVLLSF